MSYFKAKMHQNRFRMGFRPRPRWESLQRPSDPLAGFRGPTSKGREDRKGRGVKSDKEGFRPMLMHVIPHTTVCSHI